MPTEIQTALVFIAILGILVYFHETGHFLVAKLLGIKVLEFAFGFGPKLITICKRRETEYTIRAVPLGGFVRMPGEIDLPTDSPDALEKREEIAPEEYFNRRPVLHRFLVIMAGPAASFVLGYLVFVVMGLVIGWPGKLLPVVGTIYEGSPAEKAGLKKGDVIRKIDGIQITEGEQAVDYIHSHPGKKVVLLIERDGKRFIRTAKTLEITVARGSIGAVFDERLPRIEAVQKGSPAERAGLKPGDLVRALDGVRPETGKDAGNYIRAVPEERLRLTIERNGGTLSLDVTVASVREKEGRLGFYTVPQMVRTGVVESARRGTEATLGTIRVFLERFFSKRITKDIGGIVAVARVTEETVKIGWYAVVSELAVLSVTLGIVNLIPIPIVDGGQILLLIIEAIRRKPLRQEVEMWIKQAAFLLILFLVALLFYVDIARWIAKTPLQ